MQRHVFFLDFQDLAEWCFMQSEISEQLKDQLKFNVDRTTHGDKIRDFHEWMRGVKKDTIHRVRTCITTSLVPRPPSLMQKKNGEK